MASPRAGIVAGGSWDILQRQTWLQLQQLPGIDSEVAGALVKAGVRSVDDLSRRDPIMLGKMAVGYLPLADPGSLNQKLAAAIHAARTGTSVPWWQF